MGAVCRLHQPPVLHLHTPKLGSRSLRTLALMLLFLPLIWTSTADLEHPVKVSVAQHEKSRLLTITAIADALITNVVVTTHPALHITDHAFFDLKPSAVHKEVSHAFHMSTEQCYIQIKPALAANLIDRQHKMFVLVNSQILPAMPMIPGHPIDPLHPLFESRLDPGINRVEIQIRAALPAAARRPGELDYEEEFWAMFPNVQRK
jgi:hypothetical protein